MPDAYKHLDSRDNVHSMILRLTNFKDYLPLITGCNSQGKYDNDGNWMPAEPAYQPIYTQDDCLNLELALHNLAEETKLIVSGCLESEKWQIETEARRILLHTYNTLLEPTSKNCKYLHKIAHEVSGQNNTWAKVGVILGTIAGLLLGIVPGLLIAQYHSEKQTWKNHSQKGLCLLAHNMNTAILKTKKPDAINRWPFFTPQKEEFAAKASQLPSTPPPEYTKA